MLIHTGWRSEKIQSQMAFRVGAGTLNQRWSPSVTHGYGKRVIHWKAVSYHLVGAVAGRTPTWMPCCEISCANWLFLSLKKEKVMFPSFLQRPCLPHHQQGNAVLLLGRKGKSPHWLSPWNQTWNWWDSGSGKPGSISHALLLLNEVAASMPISDTSLAFCLLSATWAMSLM